MSETRQAVVFEDSLTGRGYLPALTPLHQVEAETGIRAGEGGVALGLPSICLSLRYPLFGSVCFSIRTSIQRWPHAMQTDWLRLL